MENPKVTIGGFKVTEKSLYSRENTNIDGVKVINEVYVGTDKIGLGKKPNEEGYVVELNKDGTPKKKEIIRKIHQSNLKEINGKPYRYE